MAKKGQFKKNAKPASVKARKYNASRKKDTAARNRARRKAIKEGRVKVGDGKVVNHVTPLSKGGSKKKDAKTTITSRKASDAEGGRLKGKRRKKSKSKKKGKKK